MYSLIRWFLIFCPLLAWGQASQDASFELLLAQAVQQHPLVVSKRELVVAAEHRLTAAQMQRLPTLSVQSASRSTQGAEPLSTLRLQQPLFAGGKIDATIDIAQAEWRDAQQAMAATQKEVFIKAVNLLADHYKFQARLKISLENVNQHQLLAGVIERRAQAQINPESDLWLGQSRLLQAQMELAQVQTSVEKSRVRLQEFWGRSFVLLTEPLVKSRLIAHDQQLMQEAFATSPERLKLKAQIDMAAAEIQQKEAETLPTVNLRYDKRAGYSQWTPNFPPEQTTLEVTFAPGAGWSVMHQVQAAKSRRDAAQAQLMAFDRELADRVQTLHADANMYWRQLDWAQKNQQLSSEVAESFARQFVVGRKTWLEVLNAQREAAALAQTAIDLHWSALVTQWQVLAETGQWVQVCKPHCVND